MRLPFCLPIPLPAHDEAESSNSFIEQRSSRSRLNISLRCFTTLLESYRIPKQLLNFACCFGLPSGEMELSPPPTMFRWHSAETKKHFGKDDISAGTQSKYLRMRLCPSICGTQLSWRRKSLVASAITSVPARVAFIDLDFHCSIKWNAPRTTALPFQECRTAKGSVHHPSHIDECGSSYLAWLSCLYR